MRRVNPGLFGSSRSGEKARKKSRSIARPGSFEGGNEDLFGRAGIRRGLEHDELPGPGRRRDLAGRGFDVGEVRLAVRRQRRRDADEDGVRFGEAGEVARRLEAALPVQLLEDRVRKMSDVGAVRLQGRDLGGVDVETQDWKARAGKPGDEGKAHVAQADDPDGGDAGADQLLEGPGGRDGGHSPPR